MLKKIGLSLLLAAATVSAESYAITSNIPQAAGSTVIYELRPNQPQEIANYMFWPIEANCQIASEDEGDVLYAVALAKSGKLNEIPWTKGDSLSVTVHNGENLKIYAERGAKVSITNQGLHTVIATCSN